MCCLEYNSEPAQHFATVPTGILSNADYLEFQQVSAHGTLLSRPIPALIIRERETTFLAFRHGTLALEAYAECWRQFIVRIVCFQYCHDVELRHQIAKTTKTNPMLKSTSISP